MREFLSACYDYLGTIIILGILLVVAIKQVIATYQESKK